MNTVNALKIQVDVWLGNRIISTEFTILPHLKDNRTLLGCDFLDKAHIILNIPMNAWYVCGNNERKFQFLKNLILEN